MDRAGLAGLLMALRSKGVTDRRVLAAFEAVPRALFLDALDRGRAYKDYALPAPCGQTATAPSTIGLMLQALGVAAEHKVLEIGCGSGFQAALLGRLAAQVVTLDRYRTVVEFAAGRFATLRIENVAAVAADGFEGHPRGAPFDRIILSGAHDHVPQPLIDQLADRGMLLAPVGRASPQTLVRITRDGLSIRREEIGGVRMPQLIEGMARRL
jgi:protein-L-isoaspartate(D-aspartate) O-methyltransferase